MFYRGKFFIWEENQKVFFSLFSVFLIVEFFSFFLIFALENFKFFFSFSFVESKNPIAKVNRRQGKTFTRFDEDQRENAAWKSIRFIIKLVRCFNMNFLHKVKFFSSFFFWSFFLRGGMGNFSFSHFYLSRSWKFRHNRSFHELRWKFGEDSRAFFLRKAL